jgi:hypothetical protein
MRARSAENSEFRKNGKFAAQITAKILAKWWDLPPTVG